ncbi:MAG: TolC family protein [Flavobacteriales bacterium]|nr:TolC family protein [Flavobacteriales bacterium]
MKKYMKLVYIILFFPFIIQAQTFDDYLVEAAENNPALKVKYANFEAALQKVEQVKTLNDPTFSFGYFISPAETRLGPQKSRLSLSQKLPWFGTLSAKGNAARFLAEAKYQEFLDAKNDLYFKVKSAYYPLVKLQKDLQLQKENREILFTFKQLSTTAFKNGKSSMSDVIRVDIMIDLSNTTILLLEDKIKPLSTRFNKLLNKDENSVIKIHNTLDEPLLIKEYGKDSLVLKNPIIESFALKIKSAQQEVRLAKKSGLPNFGIGLDYVILDKRTDMNVSENGRDIIMPMLSMSLPLYRGKYKAARKQAQFKEASLISAKKNYENKLVSNYESSLFLLKKEQELIKLHQKQIIKTQQIISLLLTEYSNSGKDFEEVLRMQQQLLKYKISEVNAVNNYLIAFAKLDYLTSKTE